MRRLSLRFFLTREFTVRKMLGMKRRLYFILFITLIPSFIAFPTHATDEGLALGISVDKIRHPDRTDADLLNLFLSYHADIHNVIIGGEFSTFLFVEGGLRGMIGYRFKPAYVDITPFCVWGTYALWSEVTSGPGVGLNLSLKSLPFSMSFSLIRNDAPDDPAYSGYWTTVGMALDIWKLLE